jgi:hypothetical protein
MAIKMAIRGAGGEIGMTTFEALYAMRRPRFDAFKAAVGGRVTALVRLKPGADLENNITTDRFFRKLIYPGSLADNTRSSYDYAHSYLFQREYKFPADPSSPGTRHLLGADGRSLAIDFKPIPDSNRLDLFKNVDLLLDATGEGVKKIKNPDQDPNLYALFPNMMVALSAPVKTVKGIIHNLNGINSLDPAQMCATGSCSTHAGVDLIHYIRMSILETLNLKEGDIVIEGGQFNSTHSLTPTDNASVKLGYYLGAFLPQTTGFGSAAKVVYPVTGIENLKATTGRYYSYYESEDTCANGISVFSLSMTVSVKRGSGKLSADMIRKGLLDAATSPEGRKHIGILKTDIFKLDDNKKTGIFTSMSLAGMTPTTILPLGDNIELVKIEGATKLVDGVEHDMYVITVKNAGYDNRLGFLVDWLEEVNRMAKLRLGSELIPGFDHQIDIGRRLAFINTTKGRELFQAALDLTEGQLLVPYEGRA